MRGRPKMRVVHFGSPIIGEEEKKAVMRVLESKILVHGPKTKEFETSFASFTGADYAVSVSSCTAALHLSYFYLGLGAQDEVIVPAQTHVATSHAVELCGAKPVFVDAEKNTGNIDIEQIEQNITERTRAISIVHFLGMPVDMERINKIAKKYGIYVIEDCALAIGTYFRNIHAGLHGDFGCFSFYPVKHMTTAEGGVLITKRKEMAEKISRQRAFGVDRHIGERKVPGLYDVNMLGFNYRMNEIEASLGLEQIKRLDSFLRKRKKNYTALSAGLKDIVEINQFQSSYGEYQSSYYCLAVLLDKKLTQKKLEIINYLNKAGVGTSVYYPQAVPHFTYYRNKYGYKRGSFPVASWISKSSIALPVGPHLEIEDMKYIVRCFKEAVRKIG